MSLFYATHFASFLRTKNPPKKPEWVLWCNKLRLSMRMFSYDNQQTNRYSKNYSWISWHDTLPHNQKSYLRRFQAKHGDGSESIIPLAKSGVWRHWTLLCPITYLLTYSMEQGPSWEASWFAAGQEIPRILWNPKVPHRTHKRPPPVPNLSPPNPVLIP